jgi:arginase
VADRGDDVGERQLMGLVGARRLTIIEAPSNLGLMPPAPGQEPGTRFAPDALRGSGLHALLKPDEVRRVEAPTYEPDEDRIINVRNVQAIARYSGDLADEVARAVRVQSFALVVGGDCSILLGPVLALRRFGTFGLLFLDGHTDFYLPEQSATGGAAGMDLAMATGWGPEELTNLDGLRPYVEIESVIALGNRDDAQRRRAPIPHLRDSGAQYWDLAALRRVGIDYAIRHSLDAIRDRAVDGVWIHLDVDVLDHEQMPSVDSPQAGGLTYEELRSVLRAVAATATVVGMNVTIYDPTKDRDGEHARQLSGTLAEALVA